MSDDEYEEESVVILMDFGAEMTSEALLNAAEQKAEAVFLGLGGNNDTYFQLGEHDTFAGRIEEMVGTSLLFEIQEQKKENGINGSGGGVRLPIPSTETQETTQRQNRMAVKYVCPVHHIGNFSRITLKEKPQDHPSFLKDKPEEELEKEDNSTLQELFPDFRRK